MDPGAGDDVLPLPDDDDDDDDVLLPSFVPVDQTRVVAAGYLSGPTFSLRTRIFSSSLPSFPSICCCNSLTPCVCVREHRFFPLPPSNDATASLSVSHTRRQRRRRLQEAKEAAMRTEHPFPASIRSNGSRSSPPAPSVNTQCCFTHAGKRRRSLQR